MTSSEPKRSQSRVDERGRVFAGNQRQVQLCSARMRPTLEAELAHALNRPGERLDCLAEQRNHSLGLLLATRAARSQGRTVDARRLTAASGRERAKGRKEYVDHAPDIAEAVKEARGR